MANIKPYLDKDGNVVSYRWRAFLGRDEYGKQITRSKSVKVSDAEYCELKGKRLATRMQSDADAWEARELSKQQDEIEAISDREKFSNFIRNVWWNDHVLHNEKGQLSQLTIDFYKTMTDDILSAKQFKNRNLKAITPSDINGYINDLRDKGLSPSTIKHHYDVLNIILTYAFDMEYIDRNPIKKAKKVVVPQTEVSRLSRDEMDVFLDALEHHADVRHRLMMKLMLHMGLRRGEVAGLKWINVDLDNNVIRIRNNVVFSIENGTTIKEPKSIKSRRDLSIPSIIVANIKEWKETQKALLGATPSPNAFLFASEESPLSPINPQSITRWLSRFSERYELPDVHPHMLRHTFCSDTIANGADLYAVSVYAGHSSVKVTEKNYIKLNTDDLKRVSDVIDNAHSGNA